MCPTTHSGLYVLGDVGRFGVLQPRQLREEVPDLSGEETQPRKEQDSIPRAVRLAEAKGVSVCAYS